MGLPGVGRGGVGGAHGRQSALSDAGLVALGAHALRANPDAAPILANDNSNLPATAFCRASAAAFQTFLDLPEPDRTYALQLTAQGQMRL